MAERTLSLLSRTAASGKPTMVTAGNPCDKCTSTITLGALSPTTERVYT